MAANLRKRGNKLISLVFVESVKVSLCAISVRRFSENARENRLNHPDISQCRRESEDTTFCEVRPRLTQQFAGRRFDIMSKPETHIQPFVGAGRAVMRNVRA